jgi:serine/threonine protein kinase
VSAAGERERWRRVQDLFHRARELPAEARAAFLRSHCEGDASLAAEAAELLANASSPGAESDPRPAGMAREDLSGSELGAYRLERIVGEGSMGVIYAARQRYVERSVALKILRRRHDVLGAGGSAEGYARMTQRFLAEAEVLGLLDHPGIVPIHAFERDGERAYFTMRLVRGDDFRDLIGRVHGGDPAWSLARALGVVLRVCETMAFAHSRGVLHRDLKPSHVMVGAFGEVYIVDWGLARLPGRPETRDLRLREEPSEAAGPMGTRVPAPLCTVEGDVIGTPAYMPPEQARGELGKLDARSDVYAVGAILYHLLVGGAPYLAEGERLSARAVLERVQREPPAAVRVLAPSVPAALSAIAEKAMRRAPEERYAHMEALAADLRAYLENRVVSAHRTGPWIEGAKWLQRNRALSVALALVPVLLAAWGASALRMQRAKGRALAHAAEEAERERDRARAQAAIATATTSFLDEMFRALHPLEARGDDVTVRAALDRASQRLAAFDGPPLVEAAIRATLGVAYRELGLLAPAEEHLSKAYAIRSRELSESDGDALTAREEYGVLLGELARFEEGERLLARALELRRAAAGRESPAALRVEAALARLALDAERLPEAAARAGELAATLTRLGREDETLLSALEVQASVHYRRDELVEAEALFRHLLALDRRLFGDEHPNTLIATTNLVTVLDARGADAEALELALQLAERTARVFGPSHANTLAAEETTALLEFEQGTVDEALERLADVLARSRQAFGSEHPRTRLTLYNLAELTRRARRFGAALPFYDELVALQRPRLARDDADLRRALHGWTDCLVGVDDWEGALAPLRELLALQRAAPGGPITDTAGTLRQLDFCYAKLGREEERRALLAEGLR